MDRDQLLDIRIVERNIARDKLTRQEYEAALDSLEDSASQCETAVTQFVYSRRPGIQDLELDMVEEDDQG